MRDHRPTSTSEIASSDTLKKIQDKAQQILAVQQMIKTILPKGVEDHCRVANIDDNVLIIEAASAAVKMRLDYDRLNILNQARHLGYARLMAIEVKINPEIYRQRHQAPVAKKREPISESAANNLMHIAANAPDKVRIRLERIAQLSKRRSDQ
ncbi:DUF721 domain-containing protein [Vibrio sp. WXL103]|uniref:DUF721 domain-containing protein n=1 Tax=unclassified Vibrio TaxID=2614977 RepID=UPI003EC5BC8D